MRNRITLKVVDGRGATVTTTLKKLSERELYSLSFDISEELVERQVARNLSIVGRYEIARPTPKYITEGVPAAAGSYVHNSADDNYGAW